MNKIKTVEELLEALERSHADSPNLNLTAHLTQIAITSNTGFDELVGLLVEKAKENWA